MPAAPASGSVQYPLDRPEDEKGDVDERRQEEETEGDEERGFEDGAAKTPSSRIPATIPAWRSRRPRRADVRPRIDKPIGPSWAGTRNAHHVLHQDPTRPTTISARRTLLMGLDVHHRPANVATEPAR